MQKKKVKESRSKKGYTEYFYEYFDEKKNFSGLPGLFKKIKICIWLPSTVAKFWNGNYMTLFNETFNSFKIKK
jgi:hypothetical protein